jgi:hypothetical protein
LGTQLSELFWPPLTPIFVTGRKHITNPVSKAGFVKTILSDKLKFEGVASPVSGGLRNIISCLAMRHPPCAMRHARIWFIDIAAAPEKS